MRFFHAAMLSLFAALPAFGQVPRVVADIPVTGSLVQMVMGDLGEPTVLLPAGADVHHYQMRPSQAAALQDAALIVWVGPQLTPWLAKTAGGDPARLLTLLQAPGTHRQGFDPAHEADETGHRHDDLDPHAWLDPGNALAWVSAIADALANLDPDNAEVYQSNATAARAGITRAERAAAEQLAGLSDREIIVSHDAYGYFTTHFGLRPALPIAPSDAAAPSAQQLADLRAKVAQKDVVCAFPEANHTDKLLRTVVDGTGIKLGAALDPAGSSLAPGSELYPAILRKMAATIQACLKM